MWIQFAGLFRGFFRQARKRQQRSTTSHIESLEGRQMLTAGIVFDARPDETVAPGDVDVNLVHFHFKGNPKITQISFAAAPGTSTTAITHVNLLAGTQIIAMDQNPNDGLTFGLTKTTLKLVKKSGATVLADLRSDVSDGTTIQYVLSSFTPMKPRQKISTSGTTPVFTVNSPIPELGNLYVTANAETYGMQYLLGGAGVDVPVAAFDFRATVRDVSATGVTFYVPTSGARSLDRLEVYTDPFTHLTTATTAAAAGLESPPGYTAFFASITVGDFVLDADGTVQTLFVHPRVRSDALGGHAGDMIYVDLLGAIGTSITAVDALTGQTLDDNDEDGAPEGEVFIGTNTTGANQNIFGNPNTVVMSELEDIRNVNPDPQYSNVKFGLQWVAQYAFEAATNVNTLNGLNKNVLEKLFFVLSTTNLDIDEGSILLKDKADPSISIAPTSVQEFTPGLYSVTFDTLSTSVLDTRIASGETKTFVLEVNVLGITDPTKPAILWTAVSGSDFGLHTIDTDSVTSQIIVGRDNGQPEVVLGTTYFTAV